MWHTQVILCPRWLVTKHLELLRVAPRDLEGGSDGGWRCARADLAVVACHQREALGRFAAPAADGKQVLDEKLLQRFKDFLFGLPSGPHA